jgi:hypothetical protein
LSVWVLTLRAPSAAGKSIALRGWHRRRGRGEGDLQMVGQWMDWPIQ